MKVYVVSWVYWNGDEQGGGGFNWFLPDTTLEHALEAFNTEKRGWDGGTARVRLVEVTLPDHLDPTGDVIARQAVTDWIDEDIDMVEHDLPSVRVALVLGDRS